MAMKSSKHAEPGTQSLLFRQRSPAERLNIGCPTDDLDDPDRCATELPSCRCGACWVSDICASRVKRVAENKEEFGGVAFLSLAYRQEYSFAADLPSDHHHSARKQEQEDNWTRRPGRGLDIVFSAYGCGVRQMINNAPRLRSTLLVLACDQSLDEPNMGGRLIITRWISSEWCWYR